MNWEVWVMSLKTSSSERFLSRALIKSDLRNHWPWPIAVTVILLFNFIGATDGRSPEHFITAPRFMNMFAFSFFAACVFGLFLGTKLFAYLDKVNSVSCMHGLPFSRRKLYLSHITSGAILMVIPPVIITLLLLVCGVFPFEHCFMFLGAYIVYSAISFSVAVFAMTVCGNLVVSVLFSLAIAILPAALMWFFTFICDRSLYGYVVPDIYEEILYFLYIFPDAMFPWKFAVYVAASVVFLIAGYAVYRIRPLENCEEVVAFKKMRPVFIYAVGLVTGMISYFFFCGMLGNGSSMLYMLPLGLVGVIGAVMISRKTVSMRGTGVYIAIYTVAVIFLTACMQFDITGYETRVPDIDSVEYAEVEISGSGGYYYHGNEIVYDSLPDYRLTTPDELEKLTQLHTAYIEDEANLERYIGAKYGLYTRDWMTVSYKLKNGGVIKRRYETLSPERFEQYMLPFMSLDVIKSMQYPLIDSTDKEILGAVVFDDRINSDASRFDGADARKLYNALCADIRALPADKLYSRGTLSIELQYFIPCVIKLSGMRPTGIQQKLAYATEVSISINRNYVHTIAALEALGYSSTNEDAFEKIDSLVIYEQADYDKYYYEDIAYAQSYEVLYPEYPTTEAKAVLRKYDTLVSDRDDIRAFYELCGTGFCDNVATKDFDFAREVTFEFRDKNNNHLFSRTYVLIPEKLPLELQKYFAK